MKITNKYNLPSSFIHAENAKEYTKGDADYSVTGLLRPPQVSKLFGRHYEEIEIDITETIFSMIGTALHAYLQKSDVSAQTEERYYANIDGVVISGQIDRLVNRNGKYIIQDYKLVMTWEHIRGVKEEKIAQMNLYAELLRQNYIDVDGAELVFIFRDWTKSKTKYDERYPESPVNVFDVELWSREKCVDYIRERVDAHRSGGECSDVDRWAQPDTWAVQKPNASKAYRVCKSEQEANEKLKAGMEIVFRPGRNRRCDDYCAVNRFCQQYQGLKREA